MDILWYTNMEECNHQNPFLSIGIGESFNTHINAPESSKKSGGHHARFGATAPNIIWYYMYVFVVLYVKYLDIKKDKKIIFKGNKSKRRIIYI